MHRDLKGSNPNANKSINQCPSLTQKPKKKVKKYWRGICLSLILLAPQNYAYRCRLHLSQHETKWRDVKGGNKSLGCIYGCGHHLSQHETRWRDVNGGSKSLGYIYGCGLHLSQHETKWRDVDGGSKRLGCIYGCGFHISQRETKWRDVNGGNKSLGCIKLGLCLHQPSNSEGLWEIRTVNLLSTRLKVIQ